MTNRALPIAVLACLALAIASLAAPGEPVHDGWAWLVWGRELAGLGLDTSSGPSFKPLPVAIAAPLSLAGDGAPALWLVLVRGAWLMGPVLAAAIALRLTSDLRRGPRLAAALFAALSLLLLADDVTPWARQGAAGMSEPLLVALVLGAVAAALGRRLRLALALGALAALVRPEAWPLLLAYGLWCWREDPDLRPWLAGLAVAVPAAWILPDLLADGGSSGAERARRGGEPLNELLEALGRAATMAPAAALALAPLALLGRRRRPALVLGAGALAWIAIVAAMALAGFVALPRFMAPAAAIACALGGAGLARLLAIGRRPLAFAALAAAALVMVVQLPVRVSALPDAWAESVRTARSHERLRVVVRAVGREQLLRCGRLATSDVLVRPALAWELGIGLGRVVSFGDPPTRSGAFVVRRPAGSPLRRYMEAHTMLIAVEGEWRVYSIDCPPTGAAISSSSPRPRIAGVSGALR